MLGSAVGADHTADMGRLAMLLAGAGWCLQVQDRLFWKVRSPK